ncbi:MAG: hypothetical protein K8U03_22960 [Planctomycetia bacterium]|nr:hypothetical protein [Planctomycetia bacterium]
MNPLLAIADVDSKRTDRAARGNRRLSALPSASGTPETYDNGDMQWEILPAWRDLIARDGLPIERWLREGAAVVVKRGAGRTVYRVDLPERSFFIKHLRSAGMLQSWKHLFREGACRREYRRAWELAERGVPATRPIGVGEQRRGVRARDSYLITEAIPEACSLDEYVAVHLPRVPPAQRNERRLRLIEAAARLCATAHQAGVFHHDLHGGNILIAHAEAVAAQDRPPQLYLADLPSVTISAGLDEAGTRESLAMLCAGFLSRMSETERRRFWKAYLVARPEFRVADVERSGRAIRNAAFAYARRIVRKRDKRAWTDNRDFYCLETAEGFAHAVSDLPRKTVEELLHSPERLWQANVDRPVKISHGSLVVEAELPLDDGALRVAVKDHEDYLLTEWLTGAQDLHLYGWDLARRGSANRRHCVRRGAETLGRLVGRLHDQGFSHRDLKGNNLLLREVDSGANAPKVEAFLIDLDGLRFRGHVSFASCCKNLTRLALSAEMHPWISQTDRLRFLRAYLKRMPENRRTWKTWWRTVGGRLAAELQQIRATGKIIN